MDVAVERNQWAQRGVLGTEVAPSMTSSSSTDRSNTWPADEELQAEMSWAYSKGRPGGD